MQNIWTDRSENDSTVQGKRKLKFPLKDGDSKTRSKADWTDRVLSYLLMRDPTFSLCSWTNRCRWFSSSAGVTFSSNMDDYILSKMKTYATRLLLNLLRVKQFRAKVYDCAKNDQSSWIRPIWYMRACLVPHFMMTMTFCAVSMTLR